MGLPAGGQYVRPLGETAKHHHHATAAPRRNSMRRSLSAPDLHLAMRALRKSRAKVSKASVGPAALFHPHRPTVGIRRDLLRGGRPHLKNVHELDSEAGSVTSAAERDHTRQRMREAHNQRLEQERVAQLRERVRLFGLKVATRVAQIKATRAKHKRAAKLAAAVGSTLHTGRIRNNSKRHASGASSSFVPSSRAVSSHPLPPPIDVPESKMDELAGGHLSPSFFADNATAGRVHWTILTDAPSSSSLIPFPAPGSQQEAALIQRIAEHSVDREQEHIAALTAAQGGVQHIPSDATAPPFTVQLPILLATDATDTPEPLLVMPVTPHIVNTPPVHANLIGEYLDLESGTDANRDETGDTKEEENRDAC